MTRLALAAGKSPGRWSSDSGQPGAGPAKEIDPEAGGVDSRCMNGRLFFVLPCALALAGCPAVGEEKAKAPVRADATGTDSALRLVLREIRDPGMDNIVSHTLLVPEDWEVQGGVVWTPGRRPFVHNNIGVMGPDGPELWFQPTFTFTYEQIPPRMQQYLAMQGQTLPQPGTLQADGSIWVSPPENISQIVLRDLIPVGRPQAGEVRVVDVEHLGEVEAAMREALAPVLQQVEYSIMLSRQQGMDGSVSIRAEAVSLEYAEDGTRFRESLPVVVMMFTMVTPDYSGQFGGPIVKYNWSVILLPTVRAPVEKFEESEPLFVAIANSMRPTIEWQARIDELERRISQMEHEQRMGAIRDFGRVQREIAQSNMEISQMQQSSFEKRMASQDRMSRSFSNAIRDVDDFRRPDGGSVSLPAHYNHVYTDSHGGYILSNDPNFDPNRVDQRGGWQRMERAR